MTVGAYLRLVFEAHVVLDVLTRHANVVRDLVDFIALLSEREDARAAQAVDRWMVDVVRVDIPIVLLIQAAQLDGLSESEIIWRVMVPMSAPAIAAFGIFSVVPHWNDLFWPLIALRSEKLSAPALGIPLFRDDEM